jgi:integrase/recombinase XerD
MDLNSLTDFYDYYIAQQTALAGRERMRSTIRTYHTRYRNMLKYLTYLNRLDITPSEIKIRFIREFETWLKSENACGNDYVMKNIQMLERVLKVALEFENISVNPVDLFNYRYERKIRRVYLSEEEISKLAAHEFKFARHNRVRDVFIFCCYTGLAYSDARAFRKNKNVIVGNDGLTWIYLHRKKTGEETYLPLLNPASLLVDKYAGKLPVISNTNYNKYLKQIGKILNIAIPMCTHTARKTFGNMMHNEYDVPIETVSKMLGHSSIRTTQDWYVKTNMDKIAGDMLKVRLAMQR